MEMEHNQGERKGWLTGFRRWRWPSKLNEGENVERAVVESYETIRRSIASLLVVEAARMSSLSPHALISSIQQPQRAFRPAELFAAGYR